MKKILKLLALVVVVCFGVVVVVSAREVYRSQRADYGWKPGLARPTFTTSHPRLVIDQAHSNASTAGIGSRYWPLARLLRADGYEVRKGTKPFSAASLAGARVLIVANARGAPKPQFFGINLPVRTNRANQTGRKADDSAFTAVEIEAVRGWVNGGGSLLLIADHAPMGAACEAMAAAFGVMMHKGFVEVPNEVSDPLVFSRENGRLGEHPILSGESPETEIRRVMTFTGQSLDGPDGAAVLLRLPESAIEYLPAKPEFIEQPAGTAQGLAFDFGQGRVIVLGEAAMLTAQVYKGKPFGMNMPDNDNRQLALNIMHWLGREF